MTLQERLAAMSDIQKQSNATKPLWEVVEVRTLSPSELEKIDYIEVTNTTFNADKRYGEIHFKDGSIYPKLIQFETTSVVKLNERVPLDEIRWVHYRYIGEDTNILKDTLKFRRVVQFSFDNPLGL